MRWLLWGKKPGTCAVCQTTVIGALTLTMGQHQGKVVCQTCIERLVTPYITVVEEFGPTEELQNKAASTATAA
jgi:hypothetical protein